MFQEPFTSDYSSPDRAPVLSTTHDVVNSSLQRESDAIWDKLNATLIACEVPSNMLEWARSQWNSVTNALECVDIANSRLNPADDIRIIRSKMERYEEAALLAELQRDGVFIAMREAFKAFPSIVDAIVEVEAEFEALARSTTDFLVVPLSSRLQDLKCDEHRKLHVRPGRQILGTEEILKKCGEIQAAIPLRTRAQEMLESLNTLQPLDFEKSIQEFFTSAVTTDTGTEVASLDEALLALDPDAALAVAQGLGAFRLLVSRAEIAREEDTPNTRLSSFGDVENWRFPHVAQQCYAESFVHVCRLDNPRVPPAVREGFLALYIAIGKLEKLYIDEFKQLFEESRQQKLEPPAVL